MTLDEWRAGGEFFSYNGHEIFYRRGGNASGETLLLLHGFPTASRDYHKIWVALCEKFSVVAFDMIGYGFSAKPSNFDYTTFNQTEVLQSLAAHLQLEKLHVLAHDYGNTITLELLARAAENRLNFSIETVCFLNGALFPETHRPIFAQKILAGSFGFLFGRLISDRLFKRNLATVFGGETQPSAEELNEFTFLFKANGGRRIAHKLIRYMKEREKYRARWLAALLEMRQPLRLINGSADRVSGAHLIERFRILATHQTDIVELENIGHFPHFEAPEKTLKYFFEFHRRNSRIV